ncbi:hypothetical protein JAAARDRAFT_40873 [Jaapia argillacea MUCL 33604]|uniref:Uncharacterized protein n=1 Tax=Jaapia argillacea MUCL 33604 TaxID=933084 RepID=A0A067PKT7_9AGAM|nr:hypothetical protein JAAARDRAFT_40873 [Jaapia argillacea MUCL 33604]
MRYPSFPRSGSLLMTAECAVTRIPDTMISSPLVSNTGLTQTCFPGQLWIPLLAPRPKLLSKALTSPTEKSQANSDLRSPDMEERDIQMVSTRQFLKQSSARDPYILITR